MKFIYSLAALAVAGTMAFGASAQISDVTSTYLQDAGFDGPEFNFSKDVTTESINNNQDVVVDGWTNSTFPGEFALGTVEFGSTVLVKGQAPVPVIGYNGETEGGCLAIATAWGGSIYVYQDVTLPAGKYTLNLPVYNCSKSATNVAATLTGWIPDEGSSVMSAMTSFPLHQWTLNKIQFTLTKETKGKIQIGYRATSPGSGDNVQLAYDYVQLMYEPLAGTPLNLLTNASFEEDGSQWVNTTKNGQTTIAEDIVTVSSTGGDNIVTQPICLEANKTYTFFANYKTNQYADNGAFAGFWNWNGYKEEYTGGAYGDYPATNDWKQITSRFTVGNSATTKSVVLSVVGAGKEVSYKDVEVVENPVITINGLGTVNSPITLVSNLEGFDLYYQGPDGELTSGNVFIPAIAGEYKVYVKYRNVTLFESSIVIIDAPAADGNLMSDAILGHEATMAPTAPWIAYNTSNGTTGEGNGWQYRNTNGENGTSHGTGATQLFLRWNDTNSTWVYAYKVELKAGHNYKFTCDATTNDGNNNTLVVGITKDLANSVELPGASDYSLNGVNSDKLWTAPVKVEKEFDTADATEQTDYYIVFKSTLLKGNVIIRVANMCLVDEGEIPMDIPVLRVNGEEHTNENVNLKEGKITISFDIVEGVELYYKWSEAANELNLLSEEDHEGYTLYTEPLNFTTNGELSYYAKQYGRTSAVKTLTVNPETGVSEIGVEAGEAEYYTLDGVKVAKAGLEKGIYVVRQGGKTFKAVVK